MTDAVKQVLHEVFDTEFSDYMCSGWALITKADLLDTHSDKQLLVLLGRVLYLYGENVYNPYTAPLIVMRDGSASLTLDDIQEYEFCCLEEVVDSLLFPVLTARVADVLWLHTKNYVYAVKAINAYKEVFGNLFSLENWSTPFWFIARAYVLAKGLGKKNSAYTNICLYIHSCILRIGGSDPLYMCLSLMELALSGDLHSDAKSYICIVDDIIETSYANRDVRRIERAFTIKTRVQTDIKDVSGASQTRVKYAETVEALASDYASTDKIVEAIFLYERAIKLYREAGNLKDRVNRIILTLEPLRKKWSDESMVSVDINIDITHMVKLMHEFFHAKTLQEQLISMCILTSFSSKDVLERDVISNSGRFTSIFPTQVQDKHGKVVAILNPLLGTNPKIDEKLFEQHMMYYARQAQSFLGQFSFLMLRIIRDSYSNIVLTDLDFLIDNNCIIPEDRKKIFKLGLLYGLQGDIYTAMHLLSPQVENLFREIAKDCGGVVTTYEDDGTQQSIVLSSVFNVPELNDCYDEDILFIFRGLLNEKLGANIRNRIGHGIMDTDEDESASVYFFTAVLKLLSWYSRDCMGYYEALRTEWDEKYEARLNPL